MALQPGTKRCSKCGAVKPVEEFYSDKRRSDGLYSACKECFLSTAAKYRKAHPDRKSATNRAWYKANRDRILEKKKAYRKLAIDRQRETKRRWVMRNRNMARAQTRRRRARRKGNGGTHTAEDIQRIGDLQKWRCWWCGKKCRKNYHVDHRIPLAKGGLNSPGNLVISCPHCNHSKGAKTPDEFAGRLL